MAVDNHIHRAILPAQDFVVGLLNPSLAHHIARLVIGEFGIVEILFAHLANVANQVRGKAVARIEPPFLVDRFQLRQLIPVRLNKRLLIRRNILLDGNRLVPRRQPEAMQRSLQLVEVQIQPLGNQRQVGVDIPVLLANQEAGDRRIVVHQQPAVAIQQLAPRRQHRHLANAVLLRQHPPTVARQAPARRHSPPTSTSIMIRMPYCTTVSFNAGSFSSRFRAEQLERQRRILASFGQFSTRALGLQEDANCLLTQEFLPVGAKLARWARRFDASLSMPDIIQACRNAWTACGLQPLLGEPLRITPSILAYSLLYPYSDNYLDSEAISAQAKRAFGERFRDRLRGMKLAVQDSREAALWTMVQLIEDQYPRADFPQVFECLLAIHRAQQESIAQVNAQITIVPESASDPAAEKAPPQSENSPPRAAAHPASSIASPNPAAPAMTSAMIALESSVRAKFSIIRMVLFSTTIRIPTEAARNPQTVFAIP
jgi:hypothetical protein